MMVSPLLSSLELLSTPAGKLIQIFEHLQDLHSPWGLTLAPGDFGAFSHHLLVGQFGSGEILAYDFVIQAGSRWRFCCESATGR